MLNTDGQKYGGSGAGNAAGIVARIADDGTPYLRLRLPALGLLMLKRDPTAQA